MKYDAQKPSLTSLVPEIVVYLPLVLGACVGACTRAGVYGGGSVQTQVKARIFNANFQFSMEVLFDRLVQSNFSFTHVALGKYRYDSHT